MIIEYDFPKLKKKVTVYRVFKKSHRILAKIETQPKTHYGRYFEL